jgi:hypothetical protein
MDLTAWFGSQGVFSTGEAAHIFGSGPVQRQHRLHFAIGPNCARKTRAGRRVAMPEELGRRHRVVGWQQLLTFQFL